MNSATEAVRESHEAARAPEVEVKAITRGWICLSAESLRALQIGINRNLHEDGTDIANKIIYMETFNNEQDEDGFHFHLIWEKHQQEFYPTSPIDDRVTARLCREYLARLEAV